MGDKSGEGGDWEFEEVLGGVEVRSGVEARKGEEVEGWRRGAGVGEEVLGVEKRRGGWRRGAGVKKACGG
jgi:hypothetical protein